MKRLWLQCVILARATNLLETLQQINTVHLGGAVTGFIEEVKGEEIILAGIPKASPVRHLGWGLWEDR